MRTLDYVECSLAIWINTKWQSEKFLYSDKSHKNCKACSTVAESLSIKKITFGNGKLKSLWCRDYWIIVCLYSSYGGVLHAWI